MSSQLTKWEEALKEKTEYKVKLEAALNQVTAEILQLQGGIQFAKETVETAPVQEGQDTEGAEESAQ
tara:strand:- start:479 stop:679 length:201 start_codon:yes stop_codon:yes gene_type:complete